MKFKQRLLQDSPLSTKSEIDAFFVFVKLRHTLIDKVLKELLLTHTVTELHDYLMHVIELYNKNYKTVQKKKVNCLNGKKVKNVKRTFFSIDAQKTLSVFSKYSFRETNKGNTLSEKGYEYGLSDW